MRRQIIIIISNAEYSGVYQRWKVHGSSVLGEVDACRVSSSYIVKVATIGRTSYTTCAYRSWLRIAVWRRDSADTMQICVGKCHSNIINIGQSQSETNISIIWSLWNRSYINHSKRSRRVHTVGHLPSRASSRVDHPDRSGTGHCPWLPVRVLLHQICHQWSLSLVHQSLMRISSSLQICSSCQNTYLPKLYYSDGVLLLQLTIEVFRLKYSLFIDMSHQTFTRNT